MVKHNELVDRYFPLFLNVTNQKCLVVGGGTLAAEKARLLLDFGALVTILCPRIGEEIWPLEENYISCSVENRNFQARDLNGIALVISATGNIEVDSMIASAAQTASVPVNVVDNKKLSTFSVAAIVDRGSIQIAVSSGGKAPSLVARLKDELEVLLPQNLGVLADLASKMRPAVKKILPKIESRRKFWRKFFEGDNAQTYLLSNQGVEPKEVKSLVQRITGSGSFPPSVSIVGSGPGDPDLLTVKALRKIQEADVLVYDRLVGVEILKRARKESKKIFVGKSKGQHTCGQAEINDILLQEALPGRNVVRLKGGDPFVFGRGGEERAFLMQHGIEVEIVSGITAVLGCGAASGIPMTHRNISQAVTFITGHGDGDLSVDWKALAQLGHTLVIYMGIGAAHGIAANLISNGMPSRTPVAVVENGTTPDEKLVVGKLETLSLLISESNITPPAIIIVGDVVDQARLEVIRLADKARASGMGQNEDVNKEAKISEAVA